MHIESIDYIVRVLSNDEYTVACIAFMSNGDSMTSITTCYRGSPNDYVEGLELGPEDNLEIIDERG